MNSSHDQRLSFAREALEGLSVGDAIGECLSYNFYEVRERADFSVFRDGTVRYTDDTEMALAIFECLSNFQTIAEETLAEFFAHRFFLDPDRGYGRMARKILREFTSGVAWEKASSTAFGGGSFGNGAAMRVAPVGAYFSDDLETVVEMATKSARVTHYHPEGIAGAIAVALAAALATQFRNRNSDFRSEFWPTIFKYLPEGEVNRKLRMAEGFGEDFSGAEAAKLLGNGAEISAQDTVPFCIWNAFRQIENFEEAILSTIEVGGDCDTNCAIVGGIVASFTGEAGIHREWLRVRETLQFYRTQ